MQIVIDIPEHYLENNIKRELPITLSEDNIVAILPEGHGRLKDEDEILKKLKPLLDKNALSMAIETIITFAPTIIEADRE